MLPRIKIKQILSCQSPKIYISNSIMKPLKNWLNLTATIILCTGQSLFSSRNCFQSYHKKMYHEIQLKLLNINEMNKLVWILFRTQRNDLKKEWVVEIKLVLHHISFNHSLKQLIFDDNLNHIYLKYKKVNVASAKNAREIAYPVT